MPRLPHRRGNSVSFALMRLRQLAGLAIATIAATLLLAPAAGAGFQNLYDDYSADGVIDGCAFPSSELSAGLTDIPADVREYDPGFTEAINAALEQAAGGCDAAPAEAAALKNEIAAVDGSPGPALPEGVAVAAVDGDRGMPAVLIALIVLLAAGLAAGALLAASHFYGWDLGRRLAPVGGALRRTERRLADGLRSLLDRLGF
jgi:hypothetical protein